MLLQTVSMLISGAILTFPTVFLLMVLTALLAPTIVIPTLLSDMAYAILTIAKLPVNSTALETVSPTS